MESGPYWAKVLQRRTTKRRFLAVGGGLTVAAIAAACGGSTNKAGNNAGGGNTSTSGAASQAPASSPTVVRGGLVTPAGGATAAAAPAKRGGTMVIGFTSNPPTQDPHTEPQGVHYWWYPIFDQLVAYDQKGQLDPSQSLASKWEQNDPSTITLTLRQGITFHDGSPFSSDDVKWNINRIQDPANHTVPRPDLASIDSLDTPDKNTVVLHLKQPNGALLTAFGDRGGMMISQTAFNKLGKDGFAKAPVGTGPFIFKEWVIDDHATYQRNPSYWRKAPDGGAFPYLDSFRINIIPDPTTLVATLQSGGVDVVPFSPASSVKLLNQDRRLVYQTFIGDKTAIYYMDHAFHPLDNLMFRQAVSSALDRQSYIKNFQTGDEPIAHGFLTPASWAYAPDIQNFDYDPQKAKQLLQASGLPQSDWVIKGAPEQTVSDANLAFTKNLNDVGIQVQWVTGTNEFASKLMKGFGGDGSLGMELSSWGMRVDPDGTVSQFYTQQGTYNAGLAPVPATEQLVVQARQIYDVEQRKKLYHDIQLAGVQNVYSAFLLNYTIVYTHAAAKVGNMANLYGGEGKMRFANLWT